MNTAIGMALLVAGVVLMVWGFNASQSFGSDVSRVVTGTPTDRSMWMIVGGLALAIIGLVSFFRGAKRP